MFSELKRRSRRRAGRRASRLLLVGALIVGLVGLAPSSPPAGARTSQAPRPPRPLLLVGGTLSPHDLEYYDANGNGLYDHDGDDVFDGNDEVPGWPHVKDWLTDQGGYTDEVNMYVRELARPAGMPPGWEEDEWNDFVELIESRNGSTAGLTSMQTSVDLMKVYILMISGLHGGSQIDIVAHSQAGSVARAAVRQLQEDGDPANDNKVHTLVALGSNDYGISVDAPELQVGWWGNWFVEASLKSCRDEGWLPFCPDFIRLHSDAPLDWIAPDPAEQGGSPGLYRTGFYPALNNHSGQGPTPGPTNYYHLSSYIFEPGGGVEWFAGEIYPLRDAPNVQNWTAQEFCQSASPAVPNYDVHHVEEWVNPVMRKMMGWALGFDAIDDPGDYAACSLPH